MTPATIALQALSTTRRGAARVLTVFLLCAACLWPAPGAAQSDRAPEGEDPNRHQRIPPGLAEGQTIEQVYVHLRNPGADAARNEQRRTEVADAFGIRPGEAYNELVGDAALAEVRALPLVESVELRLYSVSGGRQVAVALLVTLRAEGAAPRPRPPGPSRPGGSATSRSSGRTTARW
jgi:hypothetical protein